MSVRELLGILCLWDCELVFVRFVSWFMFVRVFVIVIHIVNSVFFFISKKDVNSRSYLMQKKHKANQRIQKEKQKKNEEKANYKGEN